MQLTQTLLPDAAMRRQVLWDTLRRAPGWN